MNIIQTGFSLIEVTTKMTGSKYPYGKAEIRSSETAEKHGAISAILPDGITSKVWNLASYDADRYDRGCLISLHHAVQQAHYLKVWKINKFFLKFFLSSQKCQKSSSPRILIERRKTPKPPATGSMAFQSTLTRRSMMLIRLVLLILKIN